MADVYEPPRGSEHHGRTYATESEIVLDNDAPKSAVVLYLALTLYSRADRLTAKIWASDETLMARSRLSRTSLYTGLRWLKAKNVIWSTREKGRRVLRWGPKPTELRIVPAKGSNVDKKIIDETLSTDGVPGVDPIEYGQRLEELTGIGGLEMAEIKDLVSRSPNVSAAWIRAYRTTMKDRPEVRDPLKLLRWHFTDVREGNPGVQIDPRPMSKALSEIRLARPYVDAELKGTKLVAVSAEDMKAKRAAVKSEPVSDTARQALADVKKKIKDLPATWL